MLTPSKCMRETYKNALDTLDMYARTSYKEEIHTEYMLPNHQEMLSAYTTFCSIRETSKEHSYIDFGKNEFMYPTTLLPLATHIKNEDKEFKPPRSQSFANYLLLILGGYPPGRKHGKTYMTIEVLPKEETDLLELISTIEQICKQGEGLGGRTVFNYYVTELLQNIYDHSKCENAYFMVQKYPNKKFVELAIIDDGITIQGSYQQANIPTQDVLEALKKALTGVSTKPQKERGFGFGTTVKLVSEGLKAQIFVVSGTGAFIIHEEQRYFFKLEEHQVLRGTMISMRIPFPVQKVPQEEFYAYVEG